MSFVPMNGNAVNPSGAYLSVDWATLIIKNISVRQAMHLLLLSAYDRVSFSRSELRIHPGNDAFSFDLNGVQFMVNKTVVACFGLDVESDDFMGYKFPEVRVNITGHGCKFLRKHFSDLVDVDDTSFDRWILYFFVRYADLVGHFTRLDFALDIVNDTSNILKNIVQHLQYGGTKDGIPAAGQFTAGATRPYKTKLWLDPATEGCTVYIGSSASDQMLRVYNKFAENRDFFSVPHKDENGDVVFSSWKNGKIPSFDGINESEIFSWVRFELQLRNSRAMEFTPPSIDSECVLNHPGFFSRLIKDKFIPVRNSVYVDWWREFWDPLLDDSKINLICILSNIDVVSPGWKLVNSIVTTYSTNITICAVLCGVEFFQRYLQRYLLWIQSAQGDSAKAWLKLKQTLTCDGIFIEDLNLYFDESLNAWQFPDVPLLKKEECINQYQKQFGSRFGWIWEV